MWSDLLSLWGFGPLLGFIITSAGLLMGMYDEGPDPRPRSVLTMAVGIVVCCISTINLPPYFPTPTIMAAHDKAACVSCSADMQQMSRPSYDWMEQQRTAKEDHRAGGN